MSAPNESTPAAAVDIQVLGTAMIDAARDALAGHGTELQAIAEIELRRLAGALNDTGLLLVRGEIDRDRAQKLLNIHRLSIRSVFRSVEGMTILATEQAVQAAMRTAAGTLNRTTGFKLLETERKTDASVNGTPDFKAGKDITS